MTRMPDIGREAWQAATHHHTMYLGPPPATNQEETMSTRLAEARHAIGGAVAQLADLIANPLVEQIIEYGLGTSFAPDEVDSVMRVIAAIENAHKTAAAKPITPQPPVTTAQPVA